MMVPWSRVVGLCYEQNGKGHGTISLAQMGCFHHIGGSVHSHHIDGFGAYVHISGDLAL